MSHGFDVDVPAVRLAGRSALVVAESISELSTWYPMSGVRQGMPDSRSASSATELEAGWQKAFAAWGRDMERHGHALGTAAAEYVQTDQTSAALLRSLVGRRG